MKKQYSQGEMQVPDNKDQLNKRPVWITAFCIFIYILIGLIILGSVYIILNSGLIIFYTPIPVLILLVISFLVIMNFGLWKMKRFGVILYSIAAGIFILSSLYGIFMSMGSLRSFLRVIGASIVELGVSIVLMVYLWKNFSKMS
jgi:hypothetical protein